MSLFAPAVAQDATDEQTLAIESLRGVFSTYRTIDRYSTIMTTTMDMEMAGPDTGYADTYADREYQTTIRFDRPDRLFLQSPKMIIVLDSDQLQFGFRRTYQYSLRDVSEGADDHWNLIDRLNRETLPLDPLPLLRMTEAESEDFLASLGTLVVDETDSNGADRQCISGILAAEYAPDWLGSSDAAIKLWIDPIQHVIVRYEVDLTSMMNERMRELSQASPDAGVDPIQFKKMVVISAISDQQTNAALDDGAFAFDWEGNGFEADNSNAPPNSAPNQDPETQDSAPPDDNEDGAKQSFLAEFAPQKLHELETIRPGQMFGYPIKADVDADGRDELIVTSIGNAVQIIKVDGSRRTVQLDGLPSQYPAYVFVIPVDDRLCFAAGTQVDSPASLNRCYVGVWEIDGRQVWMKRLKLPDSTAVAPLFQTFDITGDDEPELLLAYRLSRFNEDYELDHSSQKSFLVIYSAAGELLSRRELPDMARSLEFLRDDQGNPLIHVVTMSTVLRFQFDENALQPVE